MEAVKTKLIGQDTLQGRCDAVAPSKALVVSLSKKSYPYCLVLADSRNGVERDFTIELR